MAASSEESFKVCGLCSQVCNGSVFLLGPSYTRLFKAHGLSTYIYVVKYLSSRTRGYYEVEALICMPFKRDLKLCSWWMNPWRSLLR